LTRANRLCFQWRVGGTKRFQTQTRAYLIVMLGVVVATATGTVRESISMMIIALALLLDIGDGSEKAHPQDE